MLASSNGAGEDGQGTVLYYANLNGKFNSHIQLEG